MWFACDHAACKWQRRDEDPEGLSVKPRLYAYSLIILQQQMGASSLQVMFRGCKGL